MNRNLKISGTDSRRIERGIQFIIERRASNKSALFAKSVKIKNKKQKRNIRKDEIEEKDKR